MAKLIIQCLDEAGNRVDFVTSPKKGQELVDLYPTYQTWLEKNGFTQVKGRKPKKVWEFDGRNCPKCGKSEVWDNRERIKSGEFNRKSPHFACKDKVCGWAVWSGGYKVMDIVQEAKKIFR